MYSSLCSTHHVGQSWACAKLPYLPKVISHCHFQGGTPDIYVIRAQTARLHDRQLYTHASPCANHTGCWQRCKAFWSCGMHSGTVSRWHKIALWKQAEYLLGCSHEVEELGASILPPIALPILLCPAEGRNARVERCCTNRDKRKYPDQKDCMYCLSSSKIRFQVLCAVLSEQRAANGGNAVRTTAAGIDLDHISTQCLAELHKGMSC